MQITDNRRNPNKVQINLYSRISCLILCEKPWKKRQNRILDESEYFEDELFRENIFEFFFSKSDPKHQSM